MTALTLFFAFFKTGLLSIGGGLATIPFLYQIAEKHGWFSAAQIPDMLALAQMLPGAIGINMAAFAGAGVAHWGAACAALGMITPQIAIVALIARRLETLEQHRTVRHIFMMVQPAAAGLLGAVVLTIFCQTALQNGAVAGSFIIKERELLLILVFFAVFRSFKKIPIAVFILIAGLTGILLRLD